MSVALSDLVTRLQDDVPARNSIPSADQYERAVKDAVADFSRRSGRIKITSLSIVSGTASYALPADFVKLVGLEAIAGPGGIINSPSGLIPVSATFEERWTVADSQITFYPTPSYTLARDLEYQAGWILDTGDQYQEMGDLEAGIILKLAAAHALTFQANKAAQEAWQYQIGDERVSKERLAEALRAQAKESRDAYEVELKTYSSGMGGGPVGMRATYPPGSYS